MGKIRPGKSHNLAWRGLVADMRDTGVCLFSHHMLLQRFQLVSTLCECIRQDMDGIADMVHDTVSEVQSETLEIQHNPQMQVIASKHAE